MKSLLIAAIGISMGILMSRLKNAEFAKRLNGFIFEEQNADEEKVSTDEAKAADSETDKTKPAESKTDEAKPAESKTDEADSAEADSIDSKTDSEELPDFLEYELNEEKKRLKMMRKTSLKMVEKSFDKLEKTAESKTKSKVKDLEAETDEYVIFSMNKLNNPQSQYSPYIDKNDANSKKN